MRAKSGLIYIWYKYHALYTVQCTMYIPLSYIFYVPLDVYWWIQYKTFSVFSLISFYLCFSKLSCIKKLSDTRLKTALRGRVELPRIRISKKVGYGSSLISQIQIPFKIELFFRSLLTNVMMKY